MMYNLWHLIMPSLELLVLDENILVRLFMQVIFIPKAHIYHRNYIRVQCLC